MTDAPSLAEWLPERIAETAAAANQYHRLLCMRTACDNEGCIWGEDEAEAMERERVCTCDYPARVLARCDADRRIVEIHHASTDHREGYEPYCVGCWEDGGEDGAPSFPCRTLRALASVYADHPEFREEWR